jgi:hypothetical protein
VWRRSSQQAVLLRRSTNSLQGDAVAGVGGPLSERLGSAPKRVDDQVVREVLTRTRQLFGGALVSGDLSARAEEAVRRSFNDLLEVLILRRWLSGVSIHST